MTLTNSPGVASATAQAASGDAASILVLKKALNLQAGSAATLIQALPQMQPLATSGSVGRNVNTFA